MMTSVRFKNCLTPAAVMPYRSAVVIAFLLWSYTGDASAQTARQRFEAAGYPRPDAGQPASGPVQQGIGHPGFGGYRTNGPVIFGPPGVMQQSGTGFGLRSGGSYTRSWRGGSGQGAASGRTQQFSSGGGVTSVETGSWDNSGVAPWNGTGSYCWSSGLTIGSFATAPGFGFSPTYFGYGTGIFHPQWNALTTWNAAPFGWTTDPWTGWSVPYNPACDPVFVLPYYGGFNSAFCNSWVTPVVTVPTINVVVSFQTPAPDPAGQLLADPRLLDQIAPPPAQKKPELPPDPARPGQIPDAPPAPEPVPIPDEPDLNQDDPDAADIPHVAGGDGIFLRGRHKQQP